MNPRRTGKHNQVRIIGGTHRSRIIRFPDQDGLRPTSDRIKETLFNWIQHEVINAACLDLFAGSGSLGIEALSRGAKFVHFVESAADAVKSINENLADLGLEKAIVSRSSAEAWLKDSAAPDFFDLVFIDPPYAEQKLETICEMVTAAQCIKPGGKVYLENNAALSLESFPDSWRLLKQKQAGQVSFYLFETAS